MGRNPGGSAARKPTALLMMQGTLNESRARAQGRDNEPKRHKPRVPKSTEEFSPQEEKRWLELAAILDLNRCTTEEDFLSLRELVSISCHVDNLNAKIRSYGMDLVYVSNGGVRKCVPEFATLNAMRPAFIGLLGRFGLTPADRSRVQSVPDEDSENPEDEFSRGTEEE